MSIASKIAQRVRWITEHAYDRRNPFLPMEHRAKKIREKVLQMVQAHLYEGELKGAYQEIGKTSRFAKKRSTRFAGGGDAKDTSE